MFGDAGPHSNIRGVGANAEARDFFAGAANASSYNLERIDYARGPNSILFGTGTIGGTTNAVSKIAKIGRHFRETRAEIGSWKSYKGSIDVNEPLGKKASVRIAATWQETPTWRDWEHTKRKGVSPSFVVDLTKTTQLKVESQYYEQQVTRGEIALNDAFSAWDGKTTYTGLQPTTVNGTAAGATRVSGDVWIWSPSFSSAFGTSESSIMRYTGTMQTAGLTSGTRAVDGVFASGGNLNISGQPILDQIDTPAGLYDAAEQGSFFRVPSRSFTVVGPSTTSINRVRDATFYLDQQVGESLFFQLSGSTSRRTSYGDITTYSNNGFPNVYIDINKNLPNGDPNPNFLQPYNESTRMERQLQTIKDDGLRLSAAYVKSTRWVDLKLNAMAAYETNENFKTREYTVLPLDADPREWGMRNGKSSLPRFRYYWNQAQRVRPMDLGEVSLFDPAGVVTTRTVTPQWVLAGDRADATLLRKTENKYYQIAGNLSFWKKRLILLGAFRADKIDRTQEQMIAALDEPAGSPVTRDNFLWRPNSPADYWQLTYIPKNTSGAPTAKLPVQATKRPRDSYGVALPQYASDRFQDDYNPPGTSDKRSTKSIGGIVNVGHGVALWANYAQTFNPADFSKTTIDYGTPSSSVSSGVDFGLRFVFLGGKVVSNLSRYESKEDNASSSQPSGYSNINGIINTRPLSDPNASTNIRGLGEVPFLWLDVMDRRTKGYEFETVANLTPNWRLTLNAAVADASQTNAYRETRAWLDAHDAILREIMSDAGVLVAANGQAYQDPLVTTPSPDATSTISKWNNLQAQRLNWVTGTQKLNKLTRYTANFFTDYRFQTGKLKSLRVGYGMQFRGPQVIGFRGADTMVDPSNPAKAIDDPNVDAYTPIYQKAYYLATATVSYPVKIFGKQKVELNLSVSNLFDYSDPIYNTTGLRPPEDSFGSPARSTTPLRYSYITPRSYRLSATYRF